MGAMGRQTVTLGSFKYCNTASNTYHRGWMNVKRDCYASATWSSELSCTAVLKASGRMARGVGVLSRRLLDQSRGPVAKLSGRSSSSLRDFSFATTQPDCVAAAAEDACVVGVFSAAGGGEPFDTSLSVSKCVNAGEE